MPIPPKMMAVLIGQQDGCVGREAHQAVGEQREARIVKRRHGVEEPEPTCVQESFAA